MRRGRIEKRCTVTGGIRMTEEEKKFFDGLAENNFYILNKSRIFRSVVPICLCYPDEYMKMLRHLVKVCDKDVARRITDKDLDDFEKYIKNFKVTDLELFL